LLVLPLPGLALELLHVGLHGLELLRGADGAGVHLLVDGLGLGLQTPDLVVEAALLPQLGVAPGAHLGPAALEVGMGGPPGVELGPLRQGGSAVAQPVNGAVVGLEREEIVEGRHSTASLTGFPAPVPYAS